MQPAVYRVVHQRLALSGIRLALVTDRRWLLLRRPSAEPLPAGARRASPARAIGEGLLPSTVGVAALTAVALAFQPILAAVLAGILAGMGIVGLASFAEVALWERRERVVLFADLDVHTRRYVAPASRRATPAAPAGESRT